MLKEIRFGKKPQFILDLEKQGGKDYKVYELEHLTIVVGVEPVGKKKSMIKHICVTSSKRYGATATEITTIAKEILGQNANYKVKKSFFVKNIINIFEEQ